MEVILLEKIRNLGDLGEKVTVRAGYGRNYLLPSGKAVAATAENIAAFEARRAELERAAAEALQAARQRAEKIEAVGRVTINAKVGEEGRLFGSIGTTDVADALNAAGAEIERREVILPEGPIRHVGEYKVHIQLHGDVVAEVTIEVQPE